jgi:hypothetical protein
VGAVSVYLDASVIVPLFALDPLNDRAERALRGLHEILIISDFSAAEFSGSSWSRVGNLCLDNARKLRIS